MSISNYIEGLLKYKKKYIEAMQFENLIYKKLDQSTCLLNYEDETDNTIAVPDNTDEINKLYGILNNVNIDEYYNEDDYWNSFVK